MEDPKKIGSERGEQRPSESMRDGPPPPPSGLVVTKSDPLQIIENGITTKHNVVANQDVPWGDNTPNNREQKWHKQNNISAENTKRSLTVNI